MKRIISLFLTVFVVIISSCNHQKNQYGDVPQNIIVSGKIDNFDPKLQVTLGVNRVGLKQESILAKMDSIGNFMATFDSYFPVDVWVMYKTNFMVLLHPNDSLFVHFDGKHSDRPELLESIKFGGDRAETNRFAAKYQQIYYSNELYNDWGKKRKAVKEYDADQYLQYLDTLQQKNKKLYDQFVAENSPNAESKKWALLYSQNDYYHYLVWYAGDHREANNMGWDNPWTIPKGFYDALCNRLPIDESMLINSYGLSGFCNTFSRYVYDKLRDKENKITDEETGEEYVKWMVMPGGTIMGQSEIVDSLTIFSSIEFVPDPLLLQMMLTDFFDRQFNRQNIAVYERYRDITDTYIKEPFLKEPLIQKYLQTKQKIENPQVYTEAVLKESANLSVNQVMNNILQQNKGKVIYVDFWGTWCGPCLAEMPNSKIVEHEFRNEDVVFVYVCLESQETQWKATLDKFQLGGQHYLLSYKQSSEIRSLLSITGVPFYMLVDKQGIIKEKGSHLRPLNVKNKISEMLK